MNELTAIDILIDPDDSAIQRAHEWNARMRESVPDGFELDATHRPHITTLHRYLRTTELHHAYDAVEQTLAGTDVAALFYHAVAIRHADFGIAGQGLAALVLEPSPQVFDFQAALLAAVTPFAGSGGTTGAFVTDPGETINESTFNWIEKFVPAQIGTGKYISHITVGLATLEDLKRIEAEPFDRFAVHPAGLAVYHLGNYGTARKKLKTWTLTR
ncbi:MAG TPA: hypothetical protein VGE97_03250 [Nitrososphaera sp.]